MNILRNLMGISTLATFFVRRLIGSLPVLFLIALVSFLMIRAIPGGPFVASGQRAQTKEVIAALEKYYGLDRPLLLNLPNGQDWQLLHYVDEEITTRVEVLVLPTDVTAALTEATQDSTRTLLGASFTPTLDQINFYRTQGVKPDEV